MANINLGDKLAKVGEFIKENKKPLLYVGGAVAIVIVGYAIVSRAKSGISSFFTDKSTKETPFENVEVDEVNVTVSNAMASTYANQLYGAMKNSGTDEDTIYAILLKLQNKDDFRKVYNAFGRRSYVGKLTGGSPTKLDILLGNYDDFDLIEWFNNEVGYSNPKTYNLIKKTVNNAGFAM